VLKELETELSCSALSIGLFIAGVAPLLPEDGLPPRFRSVALLSPDEPRFWSLFSASPEHADGLPDPLDRWSRRVIGRMACTLEAKAVFPFGGPPWRPFTDWARRSGRAWPSPVGLLVHDTAGLWISYRGGILLTEEAPAVTSRRPCDACPAPCLSACPVGALGARGYDVPACHAFLDTGPDCLQGCRVRRACPVGAGRRVPEQSEFHMRSFHPR
jgi:epoxyqueuosine reductase